MPVRGVVSRTTTGAGTRRGRPGSRSPATGARAAPSTSSGEAAGGSHLHRPRRCGRGSAGAGTWVPVGEAGPHRPPLAAPERVHLDLGPAVAGVAPGHEVEAAEELAVRDHDGGRAARRTTACRRGRPRRRSAAVSRRSRSGGVPSTNMLHARLVRLSRARARRAGAPAPDRPRARRRAGPTARARSLRRVGQEAHERARVRDAAAAARAASPPATSRSGGVGGGAPPRLARPDHGRSIIGGRTDTVLDAATTPRRQRSAACRAVAAVSGSAATSAIWRSRSITCFTLRTKSPPVISSSSRTSARSSPATHAWIAAVKPGIGAAGLGQALVALGDVRGRARSARSRPTRFRTIGSGQRRGGIGSSPSGPRRWNVKHDTTAAERRGVEPVEQAVAQRLRDHEVALGVEPREQLAARRQCPAVDVAPRLEHGRARGRTAGPGSRCGPRCGARGARPRARCGRPARRRAARRRCRARRAAGARATRAWRSSTRASASSSAAPVSGSRRSIATAAFWKLGLRGANGRGSSRVASRRIGPGKSSGVQRTSVRCWVRASTRLPDRPRSCFSTTTCPPRFGAITTSPGRSVSSRLAWAACGRAPGGVEAREQRAVLLDVAGRDGAPRRAPVRAGSGCARGAG